MYKGVRKIFGRYWRAYGGWRSLVRSPYLHIAFVLNCICFASWIGNKEWWETVISILPNLLGFTLGGFAIFIGFGDEKFRKLLVEETEKEILEGKPPLYESLCATFVHFILIQILGLVFALVRKSLSVVVVDATQWQMVLRTLNPVAGFFGHLLFLYAMCSALAACMHVFRIAADYSDATNCELRNKVNADTQRTTNCQKQ